MTDVRRAGKRIAIGFEGGLWLVIHLMIAGRLHWNGKRRSRARRLRIRQRHAHADRGGHAASRLRSTCWTPPRSRPGGSTCSTATRSTQFAAVLRRENHTLKRALTDPRLFSGIGNAYSDEILHRARLCPIAMTQRADRRGDGAAICRDRAKC